MATEDEKQEAGALVRDLFDRHQERRIALQQELAAQLAEALRLREDKENHDQGT